jgi:hypothetical protein
MHSLANLLYPGYTIRMRSPCNNESLSPKRSCQLIPLWVGSLLLGVVLHLAIGSLLDEARENRAAAHLGGFRRSLEVTVSIYGRFSDFVFRESVNRPEHTALIEEAWRSGPGARRDALRRELYRRMEPLYTRMQHDFFRQLQFHFPDTTSFLTSC